MINKESMEEIEKMTEQLDGLEDRLAKLMMKVNKYIKKSKRRTPQPRKSKMPQVEAKQ
jgi:hypothetical protein